MDLPGLISRFPLPTPDTLTFSCSGRLWVQQGLRLHPVQQRGWTADSDELYEWDGGAGRQAYQGRSGQAFPALGAIQGRNVCIWGVDNYNFFWQKLENSVAFKHLLANYQEASERNMGNMPWRPSLVYVADFVQKLVAFKYFFNSCGLHLA